MPRSWMPVASTEVLPPLLLTAIATRAYVLAVGLCATLFIGFPDYAKRPAPSSPSPVLDLPFRWDAEWYVDVARSGYEWDGTPGVLEKIAFFPAYPLALRIVGVVTGADSIVQWSWTGVVLSTALFAWALWFLARLGDLVMGPSTGYRAALLCVVYPWAIYFGLPYTESLFLLACCAATYRFLTGRYLAAFLWGLVAGLTRPNGLLLAVLLGLQWLRDAYQAFRRERERSRIATSAAEPAPDSRAPVLRALGASAVAVCGAPIGLVMYSAYVHTVTGDPLTWATAQTAWGRVTMDPFWVLGRFFDELTASPIAMARVHPYAMANGLTGVAVLALAIPIGLRVGWAFAVFLVLGVLVPIAGGGIASLGRYTAILFPLFLYLAYVAQQRATFAGLVALSLVAQGLISALFFTWRPVY